MRVPAGPRPHWHIVGEQEIAHSLGKFGQCPDGEFVLMRFVEIGFEYNCVSHLVYPGLLINIWRIVEIILVLGFYSPRVDSPLFPR